MGNSQSYDLVQTEHKGRDKPRKSIDETLPSSPCRTVSIQNTSSLRRPKRKRLDHVSHGNEENLTVEIETTGRESAVDVSPSTDSLPSTTSNRSVLIIHKSPELEALPLNQPSKPKTVPRSVTPQTEEVRRPESSSTAPCTESPRPASNLSKEHEMVHQEITPQQKLAENPPAHTSPIVTKPTKFSNVHTDYPYDAQPHVEPLEVLRKAEEVGKHEMIQQIPVTQTTTVEILIDPEASSSSRHEVEIILPVDNQEEVQNEVDATEKTVIVPLEETQQVEVVTSEEAVIIPVEETREPESLESEKIVIVPVEASTEVEVHDILEKSHELPKEGLAVTHQPIYYLPIETEKEVPFEFSKTENQSSEVIPSPAIEHETISVHSIESDMQINLLDKIGELEKTPIITHPVMEQMECTHKKKRECFKKSEPKERKIVDESKENQKEPRKEIELRLDESGVIEAKNENIIFQKLFREIPLPTLELDAAPKQTKYNKLPVC